MNFFLKQFKNKAKKYFPPEDLFAYETTIRNIVAFHKGQQEAIKWHGEPLNNNILKYKKSDVVFILGSGPSINEISEEEWSHINSCDSIGFNYWFAHEFVPSLYVFQAPNNRMLNILSDKHTLYKEIPFIIKGSSIANGSFDYTDERINLLKSNPVFYLNELQFKSKITLDPVILFEYAEALGFFVFGKVTNIVPKWRVSIGLIISLCYQMGYKEIVLCGVDMHKADHFWDYPPYIEIKNKYSLPEFGASNLETFNDKKRSPNTVPKYICALRDFMYQKSGVRLYVMNKSTVLYPAIDVYNYVR